MTWSIRLGNKILEELEWPFNGTGESRIDRMYVNHEQSNYINDIQYVQNARRDPKRKQPVLFRKD